MESGRSHCTVEFVVRVGWIVGWVGVFELLVSVGSVGMIFGVMTLLEVRSDRLFCPVYIEDSIMCLCVY